MGKKNKQANQFKQKPQTEPHLVVQNKNELEEKTNPANETQSLTDQRNMPIGAIRPGGQNSK